MTDDIEPDNRHTEYGRGYHAGLKEGFALCIVFVIGLAIAGFIGGIIGGTFS
jgi:hypothetical protein